MSVSTPKMGVIMRYYHDDDAGHMVSVYSYREIARKAIKELRKDNLKYEMVHVPIDYPPTAKRYFTVQIHPATGEVYSKFSAVLFEPPPQQDFYENCLAMLVTYDEYNLATIYGDIQSGWHESEILAIQEGKKRRERALEVLEENRCELRYLSFSSRTPHNKEWYVVRSNSKLTESIR